MLEQRLHARRCEQLGGIRRQRSRRDEVEHGILDRHGTNDFFQAQSAQQVIGEAGPRARVEGSVHGAPAHVRVDQYAAQRLLSQRYGQIACTGRFAVTGRGAREYDRAWRLLRA